MKTLLLVVLLSVCAYASGPSVKTLYAFPANGQSGAEPSGNLIFDTQGNLYGVAALGGPNGALGGVVFELTPNANSWTEQTLYAFPGGTDGQTPVSGLIMDTAGNLYGTTEGGGNGNNGTVYELSPNGLGGWNEQIIYAFTGGDDGATPYASLVMDSSGNLYGTTQGGGSDSKGTVFQLSPNGDSWMFTTLYAFTGTQNSDGATPSAGMVFDAQGNLYGTTISGGRTNNGTVFELSPMGGGIWTEQVLLSFPNNPGKVKGPASVPVFDTQGNMYVTLYNGGIQCPTTGDCGAVAELKNNGGVWSSSYIHQFNLTDNPKDGAFPYAGVVLDSAGNLCGTTQYGGNYGKGTAYRLSLKNGFWGEADYSFCTAKGSCPTGSVPSGSLLLDSQGNVYGTALGGGLGPAPGNGTVFEIIP